jgi:hypothetical protein
MLPVSWLLKRYSFVKLDILPSSAGMVPVNPSSLASNCVIAAASTPVNLTVFVPAANVNVGLLDSLTCPSLATHVPVPLLVVIDGSNDASAVVVRVRTIPVPSAAIGGL